MRVKILICCCVIIVGIAVFRFFPAMKGNFRPQEKMFPRAYDLLRTISRNKWDNLLLQNNEGVFVEYPEEIDRFIDYFQEIFTSKISLNPGDFAAYRIKNAEKEIDLLINPMQWKYIDNAGSSQIMIRQRTDNSDKYDRRLYFLRNAGSPVSFLPNSSGLPKELSLKVKQYFKGIDENSDINAKRCAGYVHMISENNVLRWHHQKKTISMKIEKLMEKEMNLLTYSDFIFMIDIYDELL